MPENRDNQSMEDSAVQAGLGTGKAALLGFLHGLGEASELTKQMEREDILFHDIDIDE